MVNGYKILAPGVNGESSILDFPSADSISLLGTVNAGGQGGYAAFQDGYAFIGHHTKVAKITTTDGPPRIAWTATSPIENKDDNFAIPLGNILFAGQDRGAESALIVHTADADSTPPVVNMVAPRDGASNLKPTTAISLTFTDEIDARSVEARSGVGVALRKSTTPVIVCEPGCYGDMFLTDSGEKEFFGEIPDQSNVVITEPNHPLAAGLTGELPVLSQSGKLNFGRPAATALKIAHLADPEGASPRWAAGVVLFNSEHQRITKDQISSKELTYFSWPRGPYIENKYSAWRLLLAAESVGAFDPFSKFKYVSVIPFFDDAKFNKGAKHEFGSDVYHVGDMAGLGSPMFKRGDDWVTLPFYDQTDRTVIELLDETQNCIFLVNPDNDTLAVIDGDDNSLLSEISLPAGPRTLTLGPDNSIWIACMDAADRRMIPISYMSCASCHLEGDGDGRIWDFTHRGEGLRNTTDLRGRRGIGHGPLDGLDTPTLKGVWANEPYLHDGSAATLTEVILRAQADPQQRHGPVKNLTVNEVADLAAYLQQLNENERPSITHEKNPKIRSTDSVGFLFISHITSG